MDHTTPPRSPRSLLVAALLSALPAASLARPAGREPAEPLIQAGPNPTPVDSATALGTATVDWSSPRGLAQVWVSVDGGPEYLFACGDEGGQEAPWIQSGARYDFRLYPAVDCSAEGKRLPRLGSARVRGAGETQAPALRAAHPSVGANKFDLALQFLGLASGGDGGHGYLRVEEAMAQKAILDARATGSGFVRVAVTGYGPVLAGAKGDLALWLDEPDEYWRRLDRMADALEKAGVRLVPTFVWNSVQFPALAGERVSDLIKDPHSASYALLARYVSEFVSRYKGRDLVEFYELTNELNLSADLDSVGRCAGAPPAWDPERTSCAVLGNYSTDEMVGFTTRLAALIRSSDSTRRISSGFGFPQAWADHMRRRPEWLGADWTLDSAAEFTSMLNRIHAGLDIVSVHAYNGGGDNERFGLKGHANPGMLDYVKRAADAAGQLVYVGEIGDQAPDLRADPRSPYTAAVLAAATRLGIPYSSPWVWEFYQASLFVSPERDDFDFHLEPGYSDSLIGAIKAANAALGNAPPEDGPPQVVLSWPLEGASVAGAEWVYASASAGAAAPARVEFRVDGKLQATVERAPFGFRLEAGALGPGTHTLSARAFDARGAQAEDSVSVTGALIAAAE